MADTKPWKFPVDEPGALPNLAASVLPSALVAVAATGKSSLQAIAKDAAQLACLAAEALFDELDRRYHDGDELPSESISTKSATKRVTTSPIHDQIDFAWRDHMRDWVARNRHEIKGATALSNGAYWGYLKDASKRVPVPSLWLNMMIVEEQTREVERGERRGPLEPHDWSYDTILTRYKQRGWAYGTRKRMQSGTEVAYAVFRASVLGL